MVSENTKLKWQIIFQSTIISKRMNKVRTLKWTKKEFISTHYKCNSNPNYNPNEEILKAITLKCQCYLPWSKFQIGGYKTCSTPEDFRNYLNAMETLQEHIETFPKKCKFNTWTASTLFDNDKPYDYNNETGIYLALNLNSKQVNNEYKSSKRV